MIRFIPACTAGMSQQEMDNLALLHSQAQLAGWKKEGYTSDGNWVIYSKDT